MNSAPATRLERRAQATTYQVDDLLDGLRRGRLRMPHLQRGMRWNDQDRFELFDSLYRGFPVGTLLFWRQPVTAGRIEIGDFLLDAPSLPDGLIIVDGQQRIAALASTLLVPREGGERVLVFDLEREALAYGRLGSDHQASPPTLIPVQEIVDTSRLIRWIHRGESGLDPELIKRAVDCGERIRTYRVPAYTVDDPDVDVVRTIFERTNRTRRRLHVTDVFPPLDAAPRPAEEATERPLERIQRRLAGLGFDTSDVQTALKTLSTDERQPLDGEGPRDRRREDPDDVASRTESALTRVARFLHKDARIPHVALCPYPAPILVLARLFDAFPEPQRRNRALLRRWLWRGLLAESFRGVKWSLRRYWPAIGGDESESVQQLLRLSGPAPTADNVPVDVFDIGSTRGKLAVCALAALSPRDLRTGAELDVASLFAARRLPLVMAEPKDGTDAANSLANRLIHPSLAPGDVAPALANADPIVAASHAIPPEAQSALAKGDFGGFLEARRRRLVEVVFAFFRRMSEPGADDSPPLDSIVVDEDDITPHDAVGP